MQSVYQHFGLTHAPFETVGDKGRFYASPLHQEALATVQYAVQSNKPCVVVIGDTGVGKSLIGRMAAKTFDRNRPMIWIQGVGQSDNATQMTLFAAAQSQSQSPEPEAMTLQTWIHQYAQQSLPPRVVVDDADQLKANHWNDIIALLAQEIHYQEPINLVLIGSERLRARLSEPQLIRVRRRVFRICPIKPLAPDQVVEYLQEKIEAAGGDLDSVFEEDALGRIAQITRGDPTLINQLSDNALIEACGADREKVTVDDVVQAVYAMLGVTDPNVDLPKLPQAQRELLGAPAESADFGSDIGFADTSGYEVVDAPTQMRDSSTNFATRLDALQKRLQSAIHNLREARASRAYSSAKIVEAEMVQEEQQPEATEMAAE